MMKRVDIKGYCESLGYFGSDNYYEMQNFLDTIGLCAIKDGEDYFIEPWEGKSYSSPDVDTHSMNE